MANSAEGTGGQEQISGSQTGSTGNFDIMSIFRQNFPGLANLKGSDGKFNSKMIGQGMEGLFGNGIGIGGANKILGKGKMGISAGTAGAAIDTATDLLGKSDTEKGKYGHITTAANKAFRGVSDVVMAINPIAGLALKGADFANKGLQKFDKLSTDGMTKGDAWMSSTLTGGVLSPWGMINALTGKRTGKLDENTFMEDAQLAGTAGSYQGESELYSEAQLLQRKKYGGIGKNTRRSYREARDLILGRNMAKTNMLGMSQDTEIGMARAGMADINTLNQQMELNGGYNPMMVGRKGMKIVKGKKQKLSCIDKYRAKAILSPKIPKTKDLIFWDEKEYPKDVMLKAANGMKFDGGWKPSNPIEFLNKESKKENGGLENKYVHPDPNNVGCYITIINSESTDKDLKQFQKWAESDDGKEMLQTLTPMMGRDGILRYVTNEYLEKQQVVKAQKGIKIESNKDFQNFLNSLPENQRDTTKYNMFRYWELNGKPKNFEEALNKKMFELDPNDNLYHAFTVAYNKDTDTYEFMKASDHPTIQKELDWYNNSKEGQEFAKEWELVKNGPYWKYVRRKKSLKQGGPVNVIPEGFLHARLHHMDNDEHFTKKGIPVIDMEGEQQAEIEKNEIIFRKEVTDKIEKLAKEGSDEAAIECGKLLTYEIIENTEDRTGLMEEILAAKKGAKIIKASTGLSYADIIDKAKETFAEEKKKKKKNKKENEGEEENGEEEEKNQSTPDTKQNLLKGVLNFLTTPAGQNPTQPTSNTPAEQNNPTTPAQSTPDTTQAPISLCTGFSPQGNNNNWFLQGNNNNWFTQAWESAKQTSESSQASAQTPESSQPTSQTSTQTPTQTSTQTPTQQTPTQTSTQAPTQTSTQTSTQTPTSKKSNSDGSSVGSSILEGAGGFVKNKGKDIMSLGGNNKLTNIIGGGAMATGIALELGADLLKGKKILKENETLYDRYIKKLAEDRNKYLNSAGEDYAKKIEEINKKYNFAKKGVKLNTSDHIKEYLSRLKKSK